MLRKVILIQIAVFAVVFFIYRLATVKEGENLFGIKKDITLLKDLKAEQVELIYSSDLTSHSTYNTGEKSIQFTATEGYKDPIIYLEVRNMNDPLHDVQNYKMDKISDYAYYEVINFYKPGTYTLKFSNVDGNMIESDQLNISGN
ncbi:hypothetical protein BH10BAC5_BH10BAC5_04150 [soil metagenome]